MTLFGVIVFLLYDLGQWPAMSPVLIMLETGIHRKREKSLIIFAGMSPGAVDLFVFIP